MAEEFGAVGAPPFKQRGRVTDEYINIFKELWTKSNPMYEGEYARFSDILFEPKPVQKPHPPIWIGGESGPALRRAARLGDGWYPAANNPKFRISTPEELRARLDGLKRACDAEGRDVAELDIGFFHTGPVVAEERKDADGKRVQMTGAPADIAADIAAFEAAGLGTLVMIFQRPDLQKTLDEMQWFGAEVIPLLSR